MSCETEARVSLLLDDALSATEAVAVRQHITECASCRRLERDFAHLGRVIRSYEPTPGVSTEAALQAVVGSRSARFWRRRVSVPLPLAAAATLVLAALGVWTAYGELTRLDPGRRVANTVQGGLPATDPVGLDRFDLGHRALLYKVRRDGD